MPRKRQELAGRRFGRLTVIGYVLQFGRRKSILREYKSEPGAFVVNSSLKEQVRTDRMRSVLSRSARSAGLGKITPRMLRSTYAIHAVQAGVTSDIVAELMGFASSQQVVRRYMPHSPPDKRNIVN